MRRIIQYIRSWFCKHELQNMGVIKIYLEGLDDKPMQQKMTLVCMKCGYSKKNKIVRETC